MKLRDYDSTITLYGVHFHTFKMLKGTAYLTNCSATVIALNLCKGLEGFTLNERANILDKHFHNIQLSRYLSVLSTLPEQFGAELRWLDTTIEYSLESYSVYTL